MNKPTTIQTSSPLNLQPSAFTLAEVMIVLAVIGILVAILLPTAQNMTPDENLMKFKKANTSFTTAIREMVSSDKYHYDGDLGLDKEGNKIEEAKYFCSVLSDILTTKKVSCSDSNLGYNSTALANLANLETDEVGGVKIYEYIDCMCKQHVESGEEITLVDNTIIYTINPYYHFGSLIDESDKRLFNLCSEEKRYKYVCLDIDGINQGEDPFGYALRADGKIIYGARASAWVKADIQGDNKDIFSMTDSCSSTALTITPKNDVCKVVVQTPAPEPEEEIVGCGDLAMELELDGVKYCITKFNIGDKDELPIASNVTITEAGVDTCTPTDTNFCCWQGTTSTDCDSANGGYSGCTRTVCDWRAANESCNKLTYLGKIWRLPTNDEMESLKNKLYEVTINLGSDGLMFCDRHSGYMSAVCTDAILCSGSPQNYCDHTIFGPHIQVQQQLHTIIFQVVSWVAQEHTQSTLHLQQDVFQNYDYLFKTANKHLPYFLDLTISISIFNSSKIS